MVRAVLPVLLALFVFTLDVPVALAAAPARGTCALAGRPAWHHVRSEHFLVRTSLDAETARNATVNLERFLAALLPIWGPQFKLEGQLEVLLLRDTELAEFVQGHVRGFLASGDDDSQLIVIALEPTELTGSPLSLSSMTHELAHALIDRALPRAPRWFSEGFATYLETIEVNADNRESVEGYPKLDHLRYVKAHGVLDMEAMWRWDEERSLHDAVKLQHQYASAWMWVHYLLKRHPERLGRFELALSRLEEPRQAWEEAFGQVTDLEEGLKAHATARRYDASSYAPPAVPTRIEVQVLPHPEVHVLRARLWGKSPNSALSQEERQKRLRSEARQAMREDAANAEVVWLQSQLLDSPREKLKLARALVEARPGAARAWTLLGRALRLTQAPPPEQEKAFLRAWELMPESTSTLFDVAWHYTEQKLPDKALEPAIRAVELAPGSAAMRSVLAQVLLDRGQCEQGLLHLRRTIALARGRPDAADFMASLTGSLARYEEACRKAMQSAGARPDQSL
jgi:tetratricopeptide (TPR) repeat protein